MTVKNSDYPQSNDGVCSIQVKLYTPNRIMNILSGAEYAHFEGFLHVEPHQ